MSSLYQQLLRMLSVSILFLGVLGATSQAKTVVNYGSWRWEEAIENTILRETIKEFEEQNPSIKVKEVAIPWSKYVEKLITEFRGGKGPDLLDVQYETAIPLIEHHYLAPLGEFVDLSKYEGVFMERFYREAQAHGKVYGFPLFMANYCGLLYNEKFLNEVGATVPNTPDELIETSEKIKKYTDAEFGFIIYINPAEIFSFVGGGLARIWYPFGARIARKGKFTVDEPQFIDAMKFYKRLWDSPATPSGMPMGQQRMAFAQEKAALDEEHSVQALIYRRENPELYEKRLKIARLPFPCRYHKAECNYVALNPNSPDSTLKQATKLIEYLLSPSAQLKMALGTGLWPGRISLAPKIVEKFPWFKLYAQELPYAASQFVEGYEGDTQQIRKFLGDWVVKALTGEMSIEDAMRKCKAELEGKFGS